MQPVVRRRGTEKRAFHGFQYLSFTGSKNWMGESASSMISLCKSLRMGLLLRLVLADC